MPSGTTIDTTPLPSSYMNSLKIWTREGRIYQAFNTVLIVKVTFRSPSFQNLFADTYIDLFGLKGDDAKRFKTDLMQSSKDYIEFLMAAYTPNDDFNDFQKPNSIWHMYLLNDKGVRIDPVDIRKQKKSARMMALFPYITVWNQVYFVRFPRYVNKSPVFYKGCSWIKLVITGLLGKTELRWDLRDIEQATKVPLYGS